MPLQTISRWISGGFFVLFSQRPAKDMPSLAAIPGGHIALRDDRTGRHWDVSIAPFVLGTVPVTQALYRSVTGLAPSRFAGDDLPVESVSWFDAIRFCNALSALEGLAPTCRLESEAAEPIFDPGANGYRLPSEAEWEYACRAGSGKVRYGEVDAIAWYHGNSEGRPHPVGGKAANEWGLHDMLGNVWEWCSDQYDPAVYGEYRVFRGGGWADKERGCLASNRRRSHPTFAIDDLGFRLARSLPVGG